MGINRIIRKRDVRVGQVFERSYLSLCICHALYRGDVRSSMYGTVLYGRA